MVTLHVENTVQDFAAWKTVFDKFERFRSEQGVRSYRLSRGVEDQSKVLIDLDFDTPEAARGFRDGLLAIWRTPQSREHVVEHNEPTIYHVVDVRQVSAADSSTV